MGLEQSKKLQEILLEFVEENPEIRNTTWLSKRTNLSRSTISRILQGEAEPTIPVILGVAQIVSKKDKCFDLLGQLFPDEAKLLNQFYTLGTYRIAEGAVQEAIKDPDNLLIITLASRNNGTSRDEITHYLNERGEIKLAGLINKRIVKEADQRIKAEADYYSITDPETMVTAIKHLADFFDSLHLGSGTSTIGYITEGFSAKGLRLTHDILRETFARIDSLRKNDENLGEFPCFVALFSDWMEKPQ